MAEAVNLEARITLMDRFSNRLKAAGRGVKSFGGSVKELGERFKESDTAMNVFHAGILRFGGTVGRVGLMVWKTGSLIKRTVFNVVKRAMDALKMWLKRLWLMAKIVLPIMGSMFIHMSKQFEVALRNVTSLMAGAGVPEVKIEKQFKTWKRQLQNMSIQYGIDDAKLADGLYQVVSATFEEADAMKVLDVATKGASATLTDIDQMTALLTKTLHSFRKETETLSQTADKAGMIMDSFFMTLARGMFTMDEFVPSFQAVPAMAAAVGVSLNEALAAYATASRRGLNPEEIETGLRQLFVSFANMQEGQIEAAKEIWGEDVWEDVFSPKALAEKGLLGVMTELDKVMPDITPQMWAMAEAMESEHGVGAGAEYMAEQLGAGAKLITDMLPNMRALKMGFALTGAGAKMFAEDAEYINNSLGATDRAFKETTKTAEHQMSRLQRAFAEMGQAFGDLALPYLSTIGDTIADWYGSVPMAYGIESGLVDRLMGQGLSTQQIEEEVSKEWDKLAPWDQLFYMITTGWSDFSDRLTSWLEHEGGREMIVGWGAQFGELIGDILTGWTYGDVDTGPFGPLISTIGEALKAAWTNFWDKVDWESMQDAMANPVMQALGIYAGSKLAIKFGPAAVKTLIAWKIWGAIKTNILALNANTSALVASRGAKVAGAAGAGMGAATLGKGPGTPGRGFSNPNVVRAGFRDSQGRMWVEDAKGRVKPANRLQYAMGHTAKQRGVVAAHRQSGSLLRMLVTRPVERVVAAVGRGILGIAKGVLGLGWAAAKTVGFAAIKGGFLDPGSWALYGYDMGISAAESNIDIKGHHFESRGFKLPSWFMGGNKRLLNFKWGAYGSVKDHLEDQFTMANFGAAGNMYGINTFSQEGWEKQMASTEGRRWGGVGVGGFRKLTGGPDGSAGDWRDPSLDDVFGGKYSRPAAVESEFLKEEYGKPGAVTGVGWFNNSKERLAEIAELEALSAKRREEEAATAADRSWYGTPVDQVAELDAMSAQKSAEEAYLGLQAGVANITEATTLQLQAQKDFERDLLEGRIEDAYRSAESEALSLERQREAAFEAALYPKDWTDYIAERTDSGPVTVSERVPPQFFDQWSWAEPPRIPMPEIVQQLGPRYDPHGEGGGSISNILPGVVPLVRPMLGLGAKAGASNVGGRLAAMAGAGLGGLGGIGIGGLLSLGARAWELKQGYDEQGHMPEGWADTAVGSNFFTDWLVDVGLLPDLAPILEDTNRAFNATAGFIQSAPRTYQPGHERYGQVPEDPFYTGVRESAVGKALDWGILSEHSALDLMAPPPSTLEGQWFAKAPEVDVWMKGMQGIVEELPGSTERADFWMDRAPEVDAWMKGMQGVVDNSAYTRAALESSGVGQIMADYNQAAAMLGAPGIGGVISISEEDFNALVRMVEQQQEQAEAVEEGGASWLDSARDAGHWALDRAADAVMTTEDLIAASLDQSGITADAALQTALAATDAAASARLAAERAGNQVAGDLNVVVSVATDADPDEIAASTVQALADSFNNG